MVKWIRRAVALASMAVLFQFGGCGLGGLLRLDNILQNVAIGAIFD